MRVHLNGEQREVAEGATLADLVAELGLRPELVAVERNRQLVPRSEHAATTSERRVATVSGFDDIPREVTGSAHAATMSG